MTISVHQGAIEDADHSAETTTSPSPHRAPKAPKPSRLWHTLSAPGRVFVLTAIGAFVLFVGFDSYLTLDGARQKLELGARVLAHELETKPQASLSSLVEELGDTLGETLGQGTIASLTHANGETEAVEVGAGDIPTAVLEGEPRLEIAAERAAGASGTLSLAQDHFDILAPVGYRALVGGGLVALMLLVAAQSIAHRRRMAEAAPSLGQFIDSLPHGAACWTRNGILIAANDKFQGYLGPDGAPLVPGTSYSATLAHLARRGTLTAIAEEDDKRCSTLSCYDGTHLRIEEHPLLQTGFITLICDETALRETESDLRETERELRRATRQMREHKMRGDAAVHSKVRFLAHLNHELRTPLNHIIGFADLIGHQSYGPVGDKRYLTYTQHIKQSGESLLAALSNMLELAEFNSGDRPIRQEPVRLRDLFAWCCERYANQAKRAGVELSVGSCDDLILTGDRHLLQRMVGIILDNALRYTPHGGRVSVAAWTASDGFVLEITDTGVGIPPEQQEQLNQSFVLGENAFRLSSNGGGLGIAIARAIAELSGGEMVINSTPSIGTTVAISMPAKQASLPGTQAA